MANVKVQAFLMNLRKWTRKHFNWDVHLGQWCGVEEPRSYKTVLPIVTEEGLHEFQSSQSIGVSIEGMPRYAAKFAESSCVPNMHKVACFTNTRTNGLGCTFSMGFSGNDRWEEQLGVCQFDTVRTQR